MVSPIRDVEIARLEHAKRQRRRLDICHGACQVYFWPVVGSKGGKAGAMYTNKTRDFAGRWRADSSRDVRELRCAPAILPVASGCSTKLRVHRRSIQASGILHRAAMAEIKGLSAHDRPPEVIRQRYKKYQRLPVSEVDADPGIITLQDLDPDNLRDAISLAGWMSSKELRPAFERFLEQEDSSLQHIGDLIDNIPIFTHRCVSGQP